MNNITKIVIIVLIISSWFVFKFQSKPVSTHPSGEHVDLNAGFINNPLSDDKVIELNKGELNSVILKTDFSCSGKVFIKKTDRQPGIDYAVSLACKNLSRSDVLDHLLSNGNLNKTFEGDFTLNKQYFQQNSATFYMIAANNNLKKAMNSLKVKDSVKIKGHLVFLQTNDGTISTCLDENRFKCKYAYITEISTNDEVYL